ncbi:hypothetical protein AYM40_29265 [Paraburkholderia phytofirmans OLGA172]|uniref:Uncharacterized protein n=1 Tax=Paraburkholderia phytofirmans OLGA172 TaxID=1417228 RepID=A0A160FW15_9BURK|nr:hypothetical protein [Paraburkholderia phytofirmans]ANB77575.1 hypothetical protein AYM40_29265 [Paraburkholderia phytofirmans OLGA172]
MLRITVELLPGGREGGKRTLAHAEISNVKSGALADYEIELHDDVLGDIGSASLTGYPRMAATVWDLVARCITVVLSGLEELPPRPQSPRVPIHRSDSSSGTPYVRLREIPEPARTLFQRSLAGSTCPLVEDDPEPMDCAHLSDWTDFLAGWR